LVLDRQKVSMGTPGHPAYRVRPGNHLLYTENVQIFGEIEQSFPQNSTHAL
jgi:hypothetical protein